MNREKYINDKSYREGYLDGRKEGAYAFEKAVRPYIDKIQKDIAELFESENIEDYRLSGEQSYMYFEDFLDHFYRLLTVEGWIKGDKLENGNDN